MVSCCDGVLVVFDCFLVLAETGVGEAHIVANLLLEVVVAVPRRGDVVVGNGLLVLTQVVVALAGVHVEECAAARLALDALVLRLLVLRSVLVEECGAEVIQCTLVIVHHHVAPSALVVCQGELRLVDASTGEFHEGCIDVLRSLLFLDLRSAALATFGLLEHLHDTVRIQVVLDLEHRKQ